jgi:hypothetical protein
MLFSMKVCPGSMFFKSLWGRRWSNMLQCKNFVFKSFQISLGHFSVTPNPTWWLLNIWVHLVLMTYLMLGISTDFVYICHLHWILRVWWLLCMHVDQQSIYFNIKCLSIFFGGWFTLAKNSFSVNMWEPIYPLWNYFVNYSKSIW